jgi:hypothetical protein
MNSPHRFLNRPWWAIGQEVPGFARRRINETATRGRAGLLNLISAVTIVVLVFRPELDPVPYVGTFVVADMLAAAIFGLTPLSPTGMLGTLLTMRTAPTWKPFAPKRSAWLLGATLGVICLTMRVLHAPTSWLIGVVGACFALTWLESVLGFCVGCWLHGRVRECEDCDVPYRRT